MSSDDSDNNAVDAATARWLNAGSDLLDVKDVPYAATAATGDDSGLAMCQTCALVPQEHVKAYMDRLVQVHAELMEAMPTKVRRKQVKAH